MVQVKYVQLLLEFSIVGQVSDQRGAYALAFKNHVGLGLHAAVENGQKHRKLKEQLIKLEFDLDIDIGKIPHLSSHACKASGAKLTC